MRRYPRIELDINFSETVANVVESGIDLAVRAGPLPDSELHALKLTSLTRHICAAPSYFANRGVPIAPDELKQHQWIVYSRLTSKVLLCKDGQSFSIPIKGSLRTNDASARLQFAIAGQGLAVLPSYDAKEAIASGKLIELMSDYSLPELELYGVFSKGATQAKATRLLLDMLREYPPDRLELLTS
jgi:DNA-binding transcriptional LysR family regulator